MLYYKNGYKFCIVDWHQKFSLRRDQTLCNTSFNKLVKVKLTLSICIIKNHDDLKTRIKQVV